MEMPAGPRDEDCESGEDSSEEDRFATTKALVESKEEDEEDEKVAAAEERLKALKQEETKNALEAEAAQRELKALQAARKRKKKAVASFEVESQERPSPRPGKSSNLRKLVLAALSIALLAGLVLPYVLLFTQQSDPSPQASASSEGALNSGGGAGGAGAESSKQVLLLVDYLNASINIQLAEVLDQLATKASRDSVNIVTSSLDSLKEKTGVLSTDLADASSLLETSSYQLDAISSNVSIVHADSVLLKAQVLGVASDLDGLAANSSRSLGQLSSQLATVGQHSLRAAVVSSAVNATLDQLSDRVEVVQQQSREAMLATASVNSTLHQIQQALEALNTRASITELLLANLTISVQAVAQTTNALLTPSVSEHSPLDLGVFGGDLLTLVGKNLAGVTKAVIFPASDLNMLQAKDCPIYSRSEEMFVCVLPRMTKITTITTFIVQITNAYGNSDTLISLKPPVVTGVQGYQTDSCNNRQLHRSGDRLTIIGNHFPKEDPDKLAHVRRGGSSPIDCLFRSFSPVTLVVDCPSDGTPTGSGFISAPLELYFDGSSGSNASLVIQTQDLDWANSWYAKFPEHTECICGGSKCLVDQGCGVAMNSCCFGCCGQCGQDFLTSIPVPYPGGITWTMQGCTASYDFGLSVADATSPGPFTANVGCNSIGAPGGSPGSTSVELTDRISVVRVNENTVEFRKNGVVFGTNVASNVPGNGALYAYFTSDTQLIRANDVEFVFEYDPTSYIA